MDKVDEVVNMDMELLENNHEEHQHVEHRSALHKFMDVR